MKIILSPAKKMIADTDNLAPVELPVYIDKTAEVKAADDPENMLKELA